MSTKGLIAFCYRSSDGCAMIARPYLTYLQYKAERNLGTRIDKAWKVETVVNSRFSRDVTAAMSVYRTIAKKCLLGIWFYYYAKLERHFAIVLYTNLAVSSREWKPRIPLPGDTAFRLRMVMATTQGWSKCVHFAISIYLQCSYAHKCT